MFTIKIQNSDGTWSEPIRAFSLWTEEDVQNHIESGKYDDIDEAGDIVSDSLMETVFECVSDNEMVNDYTRSSMEEACEHYFNDKRDEAEAQKIDDDSWRA